MRTNEATPAQQEAIQAFLVKALATVDAALGAARELEPPGSGTRELIHKAADLSLGLRHVVLDLLHPDCRVSETYRRIADKAPDTCASPCT